MKIQSENTERKYRVKIQSENTERKYRAKIQSENTERKYRAKILCYCAFNILTKNEITMSSWIRNSGVIRGNLIMGNIHSFISTTTTGVCILGNGAHIINGTEYKSNEVSVRTEIKIKSTGECLYLDPGKVTIGLTGDNMQVDVSTSSGDIEVQCNIPSIKFGAVSSSSGDINVDGSVTNVNTILEM